MYTHAFIFMCSLCICVFLVVCYRCRVLSSWGIYYFAKVALVFLQLRSLMSHVEAFLVFPDSADCLLAFEQGLQSWRCG